MIAFAALLMTLCFQAATPLQDVVHTRDGRKVQGRLIEFDRFVELEQAEGRKAKVMRTEITRIERALPPLRSPEVVPFPFDQLEKAEHDYLSFRQVLVATARHPGRKIAAIDVTTGKKIWELEKPNRTGLPILEGRTLYIMERDREIDESKKYKVAGSAFAKEIHKLTVTALDVETCENRWTIVLDNNDRKDLLWEFLATPSPSIYVLPDRVIVRSTRQGYPMDGAGNVDKAKPVKWVAFTAVDPAGKRVLHTTDSIDATAMGGKPFFMEEEVVTQIFQATQWKLASLPRSGGKARWETSFFAGKLHDVSEEFAWLTDFGTGQFVGYALKTGKRNDKWALDVAGGSVADVDANHAYFYRNKKAPRAIVAIDLRRGAEAWKLEMADRDEFFHLLLADHRLLYVDRQNVLRCFDTVAKKELWKWAGPGLAFFQNAQRQGNGLTFYKDGRVTMLDLDTGAKLWDLKNQYRAVMQIGDSGLMAQKVIGHDLIRQRRAPREAVYLTPSDTPLRHALGDEAWSAPAIDGGTLYTLSSSGNLAAIDLKGRAVKWTKKIHPGNLANPIPPVVREGKLAINLGQETHLYDLEAQGRLASLRHVPLRPDRPLEFTDDGAILVTPSNFTLAEFSTGRKIWEARPRSVLAYGIGGGKAAILTVADLHLVDLKTGETEGTAPVPKGGTAVVTDGKKVYLSTGPFGFGEAHPGGEFSMRFRTKEQDPKAAQKFKGHLALHGADVLYAHADGELACFEGGGEKTLWTFRTRTPVTALRVLGGRVWIAAPGEGLLGLNAKNGAIEAKLDVSDPSAFTPFVHEDKLAWWCADGWFIPTE